MHAKLNRKSDVYRLWLGQWLLLFVLSLAVGYLSRPIAKSLFWGGLTFMLPYGFFIWKSFQNSGAARAKQILWDFCIGQAVKLLLTCLLFLLVLYTIHPQIIAFFIGFFVMQNSPWLMAWAFRGQA